MSRGRRIGATIEARMNSSRYYGKILEPIVGVSMLEHLVRRVGCSRRLDHITIATTINKDDDQVEWLAKRLGVGLFRGSEADVLGRVSAATTEAGYDLMVRLTGDNPLYSGRLIDAMIEFYDSGNYDLVGNGAMAHSDKWKVERTFPAGLGVQILKTSLLKKIESEYKEKADREHVTFAILNRPDIYRLGAFHAEGEFALIRRPQYRLTVDTHEDFLLVEKIFKELYSKDNNFTLDAVIQLLDRRPDLVEINSGIRQKKPAYHKG